MSTDASSSGPSSSGPSSSGLGVDLTVLAGWMDSQGLGEGPIENPVRLAGGTQNILLKFDRSGRSYVLRRPPPHLRENSNETMRREARVLGAIRDTTVPHPRLIAACPDETVLDGAAFYLMEPIDGFNPTTGLPPLHAGSEAVRHRMGLALVEGIAGLGALDYRELGLEGLGKPNNYLERQVARWKAQLASYAAFPDWTGPGEIPGVDKVAAWLEANRPSAFEPGIIHGDYHLANVMYRQDSGELAAIVDWELTTIGDPLLDLGWLLATWPLEPASIRPWPDRDKQARRSSPERDSAAEPASTSADRALGDDPDAGTVSVRPWKGFPTARELVEHYRPRTHRDLSAIDWYAVLACYKLGIILEGSHARASAGKAPKEIGDRLHAQTVGLFERALGWIG